MEIGLAPVLRYVRVAVAVGDYWNGLELYMVLRFVDVQLDKCLLKVVKDHFKDGRPSTEKVDREMTWLTIAEKVEAELEHSDEIWELIEEEKGKKGNHDKLIETIKNNVMKKASTDGQSLRVR